MVMKRNIAISTVLIVAASTAWWWIGYRGGREQAVDMQSAHGSQRRAHPPAVALSPTHSSSAELTTDADEVGELGARPVPIDKTEVFSASSDWAALIQAAATSRSAARSLDYLGILCRVLNNPHEKSDRLNDARWVAISGHCPPGLPDSKTVMANSIPPDSPAIDELRQAMESGDVAKRDEVARSLLRSSTDPDELEAATSAYFDPERMRALAGEDRPDSLVSDFGALALQIDLSLLLSCSLGTDCAPHMPITLTQCATTSLCYPGQSIRQIVSMRRSHGEMAYLERLLAYVRQMRNAPR
jgi:hypothetical protein